MGTPLAFLASLTSMLQVRRCPRELQGASMEVIEAVCRLLPPGGTFLSLELFNGTHLAECDVHGLLVYMGCLDLEREQASQVVRCPKLLQPSQGNLIHAKWLVWFAMRHCENKDLIFALCKAVVHELAKSMATRLPELEAKQYPRVAVSLPPECKEALKLARGSAHSEDKDFLAFNWFLSRNQGFGSKLPDHLVQVPVEEAKHLVHAYAGDLVSAYLLKARRAIATAIQQNHAAVAADFVCFDASRVSYKEVLLVHLWSSGLLACAPLQVLADLAGTHHKAEAMSNAMQVMLPIQGAASPVKPRAKPGESTQALFYAIVQSVLTIFPVENFSAWATSYISIPSINDERCFDSHEGHFFYWNKETHKSQWCLPPELRLARADECHARTLVFVADQGSTGWSLYQFLASPLVGLRIFFFHDPAHRLSNVFTNSMKGVRQVIESVFALINIYKWRRAPFGRGKFWQASKEALQMLLDEGDASTQSTTPICTSWPTTMVCQAHHALRLMPC